MVRIERGARRSEQIERKPAYRRRRDLGGRKVEIGTKLYPVQIKYIDKVAAEMGMSRYKCIEWALDRVFQFDRIL